MDAVILAGGLAAKDLQEHAGIQHRADLYFRGRTMAEIAVDALGDRRKILVGGGERHGELRVDLRLEPGASYIESLSAGLAEVQTSHAVLVTADCPFLTPDVIDAFLARCDPHFALTYPVVPVEACELLVPGMSRTALRLKEGEFTGGNVGFVQVEMMRQAMPILERAYAARKSPLDLAKIVGSATLFWVLAGRISPRVLSIHRLEHLVGRFLGVPIHGLITRTPEIAIDIDNLAQFRVLEALEN